MGFSRGIYTLVNYTVFVSPIDLIFVYSQEKELLKKKREEIEEAERAKKSKVVMTFDLVGRKVNILPMLTTRLKLGCSSNIYT